MALTVSQSDKTGDITITMGSRFDFNTHREFREAYSNADPSSEFIIDMKNTSYMDSSALGMLLLLREYAGGGNAKIIITNCDTEIQKVLEISNFDQLFNIS
jgi:anti-anti-sigma factor